MRRIGWTLLCNFLGLWVINALFDGIVLTNRAMIMTAVLLWILNSTLKPVLKVLTMPLSWISLGLWSLILNGIILYAAFRFVPGAYFSSFGLLVVSAIVLSFVNTLVNKLFGTEK
ncbi:MAG: phage holin family protein [Erysipelotrichales bacterium]|nr:phage holin family protein [Erysipelotrichales bacterium]